MVIIYVCKMHSNKNSSHHSKSKCSKQDIHIALHTDYGSCVRHSGMAHVNAGSHSLACHPQLSEPYLPSLPCTEHHRTWPVLTSHPAQGRRLSWPGTAQEYVCVRCAGTITLQQQETQVHKKRVSIFHVQFKIMPTVTMLALWHSQSATVIVYPVHMVNADSARGACQPSNQTNCLWL